MMPTCTAEEFEDEPEAELEEEEEQPATPKARAAAPTAALRTALRIIARGPFSGAGARRRARRIQGMLLEATYVLARERGRRVPTGFVARGNDFATQVEGLEYAR
jgi:hypothetical protein